MDLGMKLYIGYFGPHSNHQCVVTSDEALRSVTVYNGLQCNTQSLLCSSFNS